MQCHIEIFLNGAWRAAAAFSLKHAESVRNGIQGPGLFEYDLDYALAHLNARDISAVSCSYPVTFEGRRLPCWPAFLLDILPAGANRRYFLNEIGIPDGPQADWPLLIRGGGNPPGNIRIAEAAPPPPVVSHPGFRYEDILDRASHFIEYARANHAPVAGSSGAQGDAPKFLLTQDMKGRWHADGALPDDQIQQHWLVKFPRGKKQSDRDILRNEAAYHRVAKAVGLRVSGDIHFEADALFVPRFDRKVTRGGVLRFGLESLASLCNVTAFATAVPMADMCAAIHRFASDPVADIHEFLFRDVLNVAMGNPDNHGRNTAMIKSMDGAVRLSPLYDFAPMFLDDQGIARTCRWTGAEKLGMPDWGKVADLLKACGMEPKTLRMKLGAFAETVRRLPEIMAACGTDDWLIHRLAQRIEAVRISLEAARPVTRL